jgi:F0F1-type ATP synthase assembly protein I
VLGTRALAVVGSVVTDPESGDSAGGPPGRRFGLAYQGAFESVFSILIGAGIGYWVDTRYDTAPIGLLLGLAAGFGAFILRLVRLARQMQRLAEEESEDGRGGT